MDELFWVKYGIWRKTNTVWLYLCVEYKKKTKIIKQKQSYRHKEEVVAREGRKEIGETD